MLFLDDISEWQFALRPRRQCNEVIFMLRISAEKALEWKIPIFVADRNLPKAYDNVMHSIAATRLVKKPIAKLLVAETLRKTIDSLYRIKMGNILTTPIRRTESLCQGNSDAPKLFNHILDVDVVWYHNLCQQNQWGYPIKDGTSDNILFRMGILIVQKTFGFWDAAQGILKQ